MPDQNAHNQVRALELHVSNSASKTIRWHPTGDWQCPLKTVMLARSGPFRGPQDFNYRDTSGPWVAHPCVKITLVESDAVVRYVKEGNFDF